MEIATATYLVISENQLNRYKQAMSDDEAIKLRGESGWRYVTEISPAEMPGMYRVKLERISSNLL